MSIEHRKELGGVEPPVQFNYPYKPHLGPPPQPPYPPRKPDLAVTPHILFFLIGLFTFGLGWLIWLFVALVNDVANNKSVREYEERLYAYRQHVQMYRGALWEWQNRHQELFGWIPPAPPEPPML